MLIIRLMGGLGNQMFQYALYEAFLNKGKAAKIDLSWYTRAREHNGYELSNVFDLTPYLSDYNEAKKIGEVEYDILHRAYRKIFGHKKTNIFQDVDNAIIYDEDIWQLDNCYLAGYWQSEKYFNNIRALLLKKFMFRPISDRVNLDVAEKILKTNSASIHIRRGDYLKESVYGGICTLEYYRKAIECLQSLVKTKLCFFVFSDDIEWCKNNLKIESAFYVGHNKNIASYIDMQLMSMCKYNIIANSSFSWWGAWLNNKTDKIVIAPSRWFNKSKYGREDIVPETWIRI